MNESKRILIVEDLPADAELARREIEQALGAAEFQWVETREAYLAALESFRPDLIVSDYRLPHFDGLTALKLALERVPLTPVIILTGSMNEDTAVECMKAGAVDYVIKEHIKRLGPAVFHALTEAQLRWERRRAEEALRESEARFSTIFRASPIGIVITRLSDGQVIDANVALLNTFGYTREEVIGSTTPALNMWANPEDRDRAFKILGEQGRVHDVEIQLCRKSGQKFDALLSAELIELAGERYSLGMVHDITGRKRTENALRESEARLKLALSAAQMGVWEWDVQANTSFWSPECYKIYGVASSAVTLESFTSLLHPEDAGRVRATIDQTLASGIVQAMEYRLIRPDGEIVWISDFGQAYFDETGQPRRMVGIVQDITARKQAEQALRESEARFSTIFRASPINVVIVRLADGQFIDVNDTFCKTTGHVREEVIGHTSHELNHWVNPEDRDILVARLREQGQIQGFETRLRRKSGQVSDVLMSAEVIELADQPCLLSVTLDISERKQAEARIKRHLAELEVLYESGLVLNRLLEPREIAQKLVEILAQNLAWHHAAIRRYHPDTNKLELLALNHPQLKAAELEEQISRLNRIITTPNEGLSGWVIKHGQTVRSGQLQQDPRYAVTYPGMQSGLYVPLRAGELILGSIAVESELENAFTEQDERLLVTLASQAAISIENAQLFSLARQELAERKRAEEQLRAAERFAQATIDALPEHICVLDEEGVIIFTNRAWREFAAANGAGAGQYYEGVNYLAVCDGVQGAEADEARAFAEGMRRVMGREIDQCTLEYTCDSGWEKRWFMARVARFSGDGPLRLVVSHEKITEIKRMTELMQENLEKYRALFESFPLGITITDETGHILELNRESERILGVPIAEHQRRGLDSPEWQIVRPDGSPMPAAEYPAVRALQQGRKVENVEIGIVKGAGQITWIEVTAVPIPLEQYGVAITYTDITARKQVEAELEAERASLAQRVAERTADLSRANAELARAARAKDEFLANMSHELRTPLTAILGLSESLQEQMRGPLNEHQLKSIKTIEQSGRHLLALINDILDLSKIEAGKLEVQMENVAVAEVCQASLMFVKEMANKKNLGLSFHLSDWQVQLEADPRRLKQILVNLLSNAVKFTPAGGQVRLEVRPEAEQGVIRFVVQDNGIGIAAADIAKLFSPFTQLDASLSRQYEGTGLGLALVRRLADLHGGSVVVESEGVPGRGSRFTVSLPWRIPAKAAEPAEAAASRGGSLPTEPGPGVTAGAKRGMILLVEDNDISLQAVGDYLAYLGYDLIVARNGREALQRAGEVEPDVILMDIQMPVMDGLAATQQLRADERFAQTPIIALTALAMPGDRERCLAAGANDYITKPVSLKRLGEMIERLLNRPNRL